jgi:hypothetical protein
MSNASYRWGILLAIGGSWSIAKADSSAIIRMAKEVQGWVSEIGGVKRKLDRSVAVARETCSVQPGSVACATMRETALTDEVETVTRLGPLFIQAGDGLQRLQSEADNLANRGPGRGEMPATVQGILNRANREIGGLAATLMGGANTPQNIRNANWQKVAGALNGLETNLKARLNTLSQATNAGADLGELGKLYRTLGEKVFPLLSQLLLAREDANEVAEALSELCRSLTSQDCSASPSENAYLLLTDISTNVIGVADELQGATPLMVDPKLIPGVAVSAGSGFDRYDD